MSKIVQIAWREFLATVGTKGFIIGVLVTPVMIGLLITLMPLLMNESAPRVEGEVALVDPTGEVLGGLRDYLEPEAIARRRDDFRELAEQQTPQELRTMGGAAGSDAARMALETVLGEVPLLDVVELPADADLDAQKLGLLEGGPNDGGRLAIVVVHPDAIEKPEQAQRYGGYDLYVREKLDDRIEDEIQDGVRESIVDARVRVAGLDRERIDALTRVPRPRSTTVTAEGEKETNQAFNLLLPAAFMVLLLVSVFTSGQYILTTTIEEKSSRVVEVLLSAVSPMQLMTGKILGQMSVGFLILALYAGIGMVGLTSFAMLGMLEFSLLIYLVIFYVIAYFVVASMMAAIGSAVNEMREAQTLMTPVMVVLMLPWLLWLPISRDPNGTFATVISFVPPVNTFTMLLRVTSSTPPPSWQVWLSIAIGVVSAYAALWAAAKIFRIGLLMFGKPPNFATLVRWIRMA